MRSFCMIAVLALALLASSCSTDEDANYAAFETQPETASETAPGAAVEATNAVAPALVAAPTPAESANAESGAPVDDIDSLISLFDKFLSLRAQAITNAIALDALEDVATSTAIEQVLALRTANDERAAAESYAAVVDLLEWSNISTVYDAGDQLIFTDCTERQRITPGGATVVTFVTNNVSVVNDDGQFKVDNVIAIQDGVSAATADEFGCVPPSFAERALATAETAVDEAERLISDPAAALASPLPSIFRDQAALDLEMGLRGLLGEGLSRTADEAVSYRVVGMDVARADFTVIVAVCRLYVNGRTYLDENGDRGPTDLALGSTNEEWVYVDLQAVSSTAEDDALDAVVAVTDRGPNCEKG